MSNEQRIDPLVVLPELAAELTAWRALGATLREFLKHRYCSASSIPEIADRMIGIITERDRSAAANAAVMREVQSAAGVNSEQDLIAWVREMSAMRRRIRDGVDG